MRALLFSDIHIHNYPSKDNDRLAKCITCLNAIFISAFEYGCNVVLFGGDLYDQGKKLHPIVVDSVLNCLRENFNKYPKVIFYAISGNHDQAGHNTIVNKSETALSHLASVFPDRFLLIDDESITVEDAIVHGVPYYVKAADARTMIAQRVKKIEIGGINILLNHQHHPGCQFGSDFLIEDVKDFNYVFTGHIHQHSKYANDMFSVGSPLFRDAADHGDKKGWMIIDTDDEHLFVREIYEHCPVPQFNIKPLATTADAFIELGEAASSAADIITAFVKQHYHDDIVTQNELTTSGLKYIQQ